MNKLILESQLHQKKVFWYVAPTYKQAKEIVWRDPDMLQKYLPPEIVEKKNDSDLTIYFKNGSVLSVKGADEPDSLRGPNPMGTILDEFSLMKPAVWEEIIAPIAIANPEAWVWFVGTPKPQGAHARAIHDAARTTSGWFSLTLNAEESGILDSEQLRVAKETMTQAGYEQEFMCVWHDDGGVVFRGIDNCIIGPYIEHPPNLNHRYKFGIDLAMHVDWTVACGIDLQERSVTAWDRYNQIDYNLQKARLEATLRRYGNAPANIDATGVGEPIFQDLEARGLNLNPIKFTEAMKKNLVTNLAIQIEQRKILFPYIPELVSELKDFGYEISKSGRVSYGAPEGRHDDCVIALALACWEMPSMAQGMDKLSELRRISQLSSEVRTKVIRFE